MATRSRIGVSTACDGCRQRKVRCEARRPCRRCTESGRRCQTTKGDRLRFPGRAANPTGATGVERARPVTNPAQEAALDAAWADLMSSIQPPAAAQPPQPETQLDTTLFDEIDVQDIIASFVHDQSGSTFSSAPLSYDINQASDSQPQCPAATAHNDAQETAANTVRWLDSQTPSHTQNAAAAAVTYQECDLQRGQAADVSSTDREFEDFLRRPVHVWPWQTTEDLAGVVYQTCPGDLMDRLIRCYFVQIHHARPVVHPNRFLRGYLSFRGHREDLGTASAEPSTPEAVSSHAFLALVMSMCAVASRSFAHHDPRVLAIFPNISSSGLHYYRLASSLLSCTAHTKGLYHLQALFHLAMFSEGVLPTDSHTTLLQEAKSIAEESRDQHAAAPKEVDSGYMTELQHTASALASHATWTSLVAGHDPASFQRHLVSTSKQQDAKFDVAGMHLSCFLLIVAQGSLFKASQELLSGRPGQTAAVNRGPELDYSRLSDLERIDRALSLIESSLPAPLRLVDDAHLGSTEVRETFQAVRLALVSNTLRCLIAHEQMTQEVAALSQARSSANTIIQLCNWLYSHDLLWTPYGGSHIQVLLLAGTVLVSSLGRRHAASAGAVTHLEASVHLLHQSISRFPRARQAFERLRCLATAQGIELSSVSSGTASYEAAHVKEDSRPGNSADHDSSSSCDLSWMDTYLSDSFDDSANVVPRSMGAASGDAHHSSEFNGASSIAQEMTELNQLESRHLLADFGLSPELLRSYRI